MSQHAFRVTKPAPIRQASPPRIRRNRQILSCLSCKTSKLKCDRQQPCSTCQRKGAAEACTYSSSSHGDHPPASRPSNGSRSQNGVKASEAQQRLHKLENIVAGLMQEQTLDAGGNSQIPASALTPPAQTAKSAEERGEIDGENCPVGRLNISGSATSYIGATHWASILEDIRGVQDLLGDDDGDDISHGSSPLTMDQSLSPATTVAHADIAFSTMTKTSVEQILSHIPSKPLVDASLSIFFNARQFQIPFIHRQKFQREYDAFWANPAGTSLLWISILFSILHLAHQLKTMNGQYNPDQIDGTIYWQLAKEALISGNYSTGQPYAVEASLIIAMWIYFQRTARETDGWVIMGVCARLAMKQGYHRDPSVLKSLSPFEGEMRRRAFFFIETFDLLMSMQSGLPPLVNQDECDTLPPANLFDTDFDETTEKLPPSRPETDHTPALYFRYKSRLARVFRKIYRGVLTLKKSDHDSVLDLDRQLRAIRDGIPPSLKFKPLAASITDDSYLIVSRVHAEQMYLKGFCILYRYFLTNEREKQEYEYCRQTCLNAALEMLDIQADLFGAIQPGGRFAQDKWMNSQITLYDYLLGAMILCVEMQINGENGISSSNKIAPSDTAAFEIRKYDALRRAQEIWASQADQVDEARRASKILRAVLIKLPDPRSANMNGGSRPQQQQNGSAAIDLPTPPSISGKTPDFTGGFIDLQRPSQVAAGPAFGGAGGAAPLTPPAADMLGVGADSGTVDATASFNTLFGESDGFDWSSIDQYVFQGMDFSQDLDL